jgi:hypothetical protein
MVPMRSTTRHGNALPHSGSSHDGETGAPPTEAAEKRAAKLPLVIIDCEAPAAFWQNPNEGLRDNCLNSPDRICKTLISTF